MNKDDLIKKLENLDLPEVKLPGHQRRLKMALLARHSFSEGVLNSGHFKKQTTMSLLKKFAPIGAVAVIALLTVAGVNYFKSSSSVSNLSLTPAAYAKELVGKAEEQLTKDKAIAGYIEPTTGVMQWKESDADGNIRDEKGRIIFVTDQNGKLVPAPHELPNQDKYWAEKLEKNVGSIDEVSYSVSKDSFLNFLKEAKQAKDLAYLGDRVTDGQRIRVLRFTDNKGNITILGIGHNNLPVIRFAYNEKAGGVIFQNADGGVIFQQGKVKDDSQPPQEGLSYGKIDPNVQKPKGWEEMKKEWTENLEQPADFNAIQK